METRSKNRLFPASNLITPIAVTNGVRTHNVHPLRTAAPRRRCRSECLPITSTLVGVPTDARLYDELTVQKQHHRQSPAAAPITVRAVANRYAAASVLRNQDSVKNIFSCSALNVVRAQPTRPQMFFKKENISMKPSEAAAGHQAHQARLQEFERSKDQHYNGQPTPRKFEFLQVEHDQVPVTVTRRAAQRSCTMADACRGLTMLDGQKRRVRSLSETDPDHVQRAQLQRFAEGRYQQGDTTLKRTRGSRTNSSQPPHTKHQPNGLTTVVGHHHPRIELDTSHESAHDQACRPANSTSPRSQYKLPVNPKYTKIVAHHLGKPSSGRFPSKTQSALRKIRSRTAERQLGGQPENGEAMGLTTNTMPDAVVANGSPVKPAAPINGHVDDDSDTGCSSLDDDDDFDGVVEDDFGDSLSDLDDTSNSQLSSLTISLGNKFSDASVMTADCVVGRFVSSGPLSASLFPNVPPYISFATHSEKGPRMPESIHRVLKWKLTTITPIVIRKVLLNTGFRLLRNEDFPILAETDDNDLVSSDDDDTNDWVGVWGKHMKSPCFKTLRSYQKINHIPGTFQIGRKDRVWRNLQTLMARHGKKNFGFMPSTYIIPADLKQLRRLWPSYSQRNAKWIIKPPASARGTGIKVVNRWNQIPKRKPLVVQRYIERPLLINGSKFDLRLYVLVTSINPLRVFMHTDGLARFASVKYSEKSETLHDRYMHLTNYSINKLSSNYAKNEDANACQGHKWTIKSLWTHLAAQGVNTNGLWGALRNLVLRTILAGETPINNMTKANMGSRYNCFELFGIDVLLDAELKPWLLEVNISPSLHSASPLDLYVKGPLCTALLNTALFQVPPRIPVAQQQEIMFEQGLKGPLCFDKRLFVTSATKTERIKHVEFIGKPREEYVKSILRHLTPEDVRAIMIAEEELARSAPLERIFPTATSHQYHKFIEVPRYLNQLLDAWEHTYGTSSKTREEGLTLLRRFAADGVHLIVPPEPVKKACENSTPPRATAFPPQQQQQHASLPDGGQAGDAMPRNGDRGSATLKTVPAASEQRNHDRGDVREEEEADHVHQPMVKLEIDAATATRSKTMLVERVTGNKSTASINKCS